MHAAAVYPAGMPYGEAPIWCFPVFEYGTYLILLICLVYAARQGKRDVMYILGGLVFGLLLEYMEVVMGSYTYGKFDVMFGKAPLQIPLCIGVGWGIIMYSARLLTDKLGMSLLACAALDTLLALNIDLSMDVVAYRLHMWNWDWQGTHLNPLTGEWFGIPYGNFVGWQTVVFCFSGFFRLFERRTRKRENTLVKWVGITILALLCSLFILYATEAYLFPVLRKIGINYKARFLGITAILLILSYLGWRKREVQSLRIPSGSWIVPSFFHLYFGGCFFLLGFYQENKWMTLAACLNILLGLVIRRLLTATSSSFSGLRQPPS
jgi:uncharacterized membrane protein